MSSNEVNERIPMSKITPDQLRRVETRFRRQGQCKAALGLLEAAMILVNRAATEAPIAALNGSCRTITKHIEVAQRKLIEAHDRE